MLAVVVISIVSVENCIHLGETLLDAVRSFGNILGVGGVVRIG